MPTLNDSSPSVADQRDPAVEPSEVLGSDTGKDVDLMETQTSVVKKAAGTSETEPVKRPPTPSSVQEFLFLFKCLLEVLMEEVSGGVVVEMHWVAGQSKDLMNQLCTYLKNSLLKMVSSP